MDRSALISLFDLSGKTALLRELPELLHGIVMRVLGDPESDQREDSDRASKFITEQVASLARHVQARMNSQ